MVAGREGEDVKDDNDYADDDGVDDNDDVGFTLVYVCLHECKYMFAVVCVSLYKWISKNHCYMMGKNKICYII